MSQLLTRLWSDEEGLTSVEYALLLAVIVVVAIAVWAALGSSVAASVDNSTEIITGA